VTCPLQAAATLFSHGTRIRYTEAASHGSSRSSRPWRTGPSSPNAALRVIRNHDRSRPTPPGQSSLLPLASARRVVLATRSEPGSDPASCPARLHVDRGGPTTTPRVVGALRGPGARTTLIRDWNSRFIVLSSRPPNFASEDPSTRFWPQRFAWDMGVHAKWRPWRSRTTQNWTASTTPCGVARVADRSPPRFGGLERAAG
jgi:hypothetical protein